MDAAGGRCLATFTGHGYRMASVCFVDGDQYIYAAANRSIHVWSLEQLKQAQPPAQRQKLAEDEIAPADEAASNQMAALPLILIVPDAFVETTGFITSMCISSTETILT
jgi:WD40 repeat protein